MNICIPIEKNEGLNSGVYGHFGSAPYFAIYNTDSKNLELVNNGDMNHAHGQCNPIGALAGKSVDILVTGGIGARAIEKLGAMGIRVCLISTEGTVQDVIRSHETNALREIQSGQGCNHHSCS
ncbi:MAG: NifB/NifX family molybdenum-iron cluster-binding protein [Desulfomonilia bacterium]